jgi:A/G-specific adenine glycosylase
MVPGRKDASASPAAFRGLLDWYRRNSRDLPWRRTREPYAVWVAEVMLQQTTVRSILPRYPAFLGRFGTIRALAEAAEEDVLAAWAGLGYYHRARNLHRAARQMLERHGGAFPRTLAAALALPGVGLYTASAVLSIAYGVPLPVVDGNVRRVLARVFALRGSPWHRDSAYYNLASEIIDGQAPGHWNQALMELGATICTPRRPVCAVCPLRRRCAARRDGIQDALPDRPGRRASVAVTVAAALIRRDDRVLLVRRPTAGPLAGLWEVPQTTLDSPSPPDLVRELRERHGLRIVAGPLLATTRHAITFRRIRVEVFGAVLEREPPRSPDRLLWATDTEVRALPIASLTAKILRACDSPQLPIAFP